MTQVTDKSNSWYLTNFKAFEKNLNGGSETELHSIRKSAIAQFAKVGFPTTHDEEWRFTDIAPIKNVNFKPGSHLADNAVTEESIHQFIFDDFHCHRLVFINGYFSEKLSSIHQLPKGVKLGSLASAISNDRELVNQFLTRNAKFDENAFTALNTAFIHDGAFVFIPDGVVLEEPVHLLFVSTVSDSSFVSHPRNVIVAGKNSQVSIVETYGALENNVYFTNVVTEVFAGENSVIEHDKLQIESLKAFHIGSMHASMSARSNIISNSVSLGGSLVRNNVTSVLNAEGIECTLNGLSLATGQQHVDNHTTIDHAQPHCNSHELYKSILDGKAKGVFNGKIFVRKYAQKTDAKQTNKTLLLSDDATVDTKPQLEIFADDVKCTHGATVGQLDEEQIFYLRSRGLGLEAARDILTFAFASDVINRIHVEPLRQQLDALIQERLRKGRLA